MSGRTQFSIAGLVAYSLASLAMAGAVLYLFHFEPVVYTKLITEDFWGEFATSVCFFLAGFLMLYLAWTEAPGLRRWVWLGIGLVALFIGGEEISWSQRIVGAATPDLFRQHSLQKEITFHNLALFDPLNQNIHLLGSLFILGYLVLSVAVAFGMRRFGRYLERWGIPLVPVEMVPLFLLTPFFLLALPSAKADEIGEMFIGLAVLIWAVHMLVVYRSKGRLGGKVHLLALLVALSLVVVASISLTHLRSASIKWRLNMMAAVEYPIFGMYGQAEKLYLYLYDHPELMTEDTRIQHAQMLSSTGRHNEAVEILSRVARELDEIDVAEEDRIAHLRRRGVVYSLLSQDELGQELFDLAVAVDREKLDGLSDPDERAEALWSIAETELARGDVQSAIRVAQEARQVAGTKILQLQIEEWLEELERVGKI